MATARRLTFVVVTSGVLAAALLAACGAARPRPAEPATAALYRDLERIVTVAQATGWGVDRLELEGLLEPALDSACRVGPDARARLAGWLGDEITRLGGPVEQAFVSRGRRLDRVRDLLVASRVQALLGLAHQRAEADCPFWIEPELAFRGRQISDDRWQVSMSGGGKGIVLVQGGQVDLSAGGAGRLLLGRTVGERHALYAGLELGASAAFPKAADGTRSGLLLGADLVAPVVYRRTLTNAFVEAELGWLGQTDETDWSRLAHGVHAGVAVGGRALRARFFFPGVALGLSYERTFRNDDADLSSLKVGARVTFDLDL
ncbi:MAG: hypothetical protein KBG28_04095 [Kofleriaceae bacterium]|nr:hypothetical protein [Kofleriaceae bacterium]MBP6841418.1 hypothetical protein [Kofleriaceae bacterium]MBP9203121.1 hypothetical protein [Kofleriaceae bacterium]